MPRKVRDKEKEERFIRTFMVPLTAAVALFEVISGRYIVACLFALLVGLYLWRKN